MSLFSFDLNRAAKEQYGYGVRAVLNGNHLWNWCAEKGGKYYSLDLNRAAISQYGTGFFAACKGVHAYDWGAINLGQQGYKVLPVLIVPRDLFFDIEGVRQAVERYTNNNQAARIWYSQHIGKTFQLMDTLVCYSAQHSNDWDHYCYLNTLSGAENKERLLNESIAAFESAFPYRGDNLRITLCAHTGYDTDDWQGAMNKGKYRVIPPRAAAIKIDLANLQAGSIEADALYALIHELGHGFDLPHPSERNPQPPDYAQSFMQAAKPPDTVALDVERAELSQSRYFNA